VEEISLVSATVTHSRYLTFFAYTVHAHKFPELMVKVAVRLFINNHSEESDLKRKVDWKPRRRLVLFCPRLLETEIGYNYIPHRTPYCIILFQPKIMWNFATQCQLNH
jgi:hypothetical protein